MIIIRVLTKLKRDAMKKIPYGISDFKRLKTEDYFFIDKTDYIPKIESDTSSYLMFLRPRRFAK